MLTEKQINTLVDNIPDSMPCHDAIQELVPQAKAYASLFEFIKGIKTRKTDTGFGLLDAKNETHNMFLYHLCNKIQEMEVEFLIAEQSK